MALPHRRARKWETVIPAGAVDECDMQVLGGELAGFAPPAVVRVRWAWQLSGHHKSGKNTGARRRSRFLLASRGVEDE